MAIRLADPVSSDAGDRHSESGTYARKVLECAYLAERAGLIRYLRRCAGQEAASDLAQDVFLRAAESPQAGHLVNPAGFLYRIARNMLIDRSRSLRGRSTHVPLLDARDAACAPEQEYAIEAGDLQAAYERALVSLSPRRRQVFMLSRLEKKTYREIHTELGISMATVEHHMVRALAHIRQVIAESS